MTGHEKLIALLRAHYRETGEMIETVHAQWAASMSAGAVLHKIDVQSAKAVVAVADTPRGNPE